MDASLIAQIERALETRQARKQGNEIRFLCPSHNDRNPSARWNHDKAAWFCDVCGTGGGALELARLLGLIIDEPVRGLALRELADAKGVAEAFLRSLGVTEGVIGRERTGCVDIPYLDGSGEMVALRKRLSLQGDRRFAWRRGDKALPYGLWRLEDFDRQEPLIVVEGESDAWTLWQGGHQAIGLPGASTWKEAWKPHLQGFSRVYVWREPDQGGSGLVQAIASDLPDIWIIEAPADAKDANALYLKCGKDDVEFAARLLALQEDARQASSIREEARSERAREAFRRSRHLLEAPDLFAQIGQAIKGGGYAGDLTPSLVVYVALTSRNLEKPLNIAVIAPSASGKNRAVDGATDLMPESAYFVEKAGSARALVYSTESYEHRAIIIAEADSIPDDGPAASAIRSLAEDNFMTYDVTEKDPKTGEFTTRRIVKPGPTALITTSTRPLQPQMGTRVLSVTVLDTKGQTRQVLLAHAASVNGMRPTPDVSAFVALQEWLDLAGERRVVIPYAGRLAEMVPADHIRMRRDFRQLLTVIQTMGFLHQCQRKRDRQGRIIADFRDYALARELLLETFTAAAAGGLSQSVRETVEAVVAAGVESGITIKALGDRLGLAKDTAWNRVQRGLGLGYLVNLETRKGAPARIVPGDPLPEANPALPREEHLMHVCDELPETGSTVQPPIESQIPGAPVGAVESTVESPIQPPIQPVGDSSSDSRGGPVGPAVERLNEDPEEERTPADEEGERVYCLSLAQMNGFPELRLGLGIAIEGSEAAWSRFCKQAAPDDLQKCIHELEGLAG